MGFGRLICHQPGILSRSSHCEPAAPVVRSVAEEQMTEAGSLRPEVEALLPPARYYINVYIGRRHRKGKYIHIFNSVAKRKSEI